MILTCQTCDGCPDKFYIYGDDLISQSRGGNLSYYLYDGLGSTRALSDVSGGVTDTYDYEAFGETLNKSGVSENSYLFTGEQFDSGLDNYYLRARYYNQGSGRFTQMDTWRGDNQDPVTLHKYLYANVDPVNNIDPSGQFSLSSIGTATNISAVLTTISVANTAFSVYEFASGEREVTAKELGLTALVLFAGPVAGKLIKVITRRNVDDFLKSAISSGAIGKVLVKGGRVNVSDLKKMIPPGTPNTFKPSAGIIGGFKYRFKIGDTKIELKWHTPDAKAASKFPGSNSGNMSTAQIKIGNKFLTAEGGMAKKVSDSTHIPIDYF